ncbi:MAG: TonB-dependent receptor, partial [Acidobacteriota bacterium]
MRRVLALMALALLVATSAVYGQAQRGTVEVVVTDGDGSVIPGATVSAQSTETLSRRSVQTDEAGTALLVSLDPADNYVVTVSLEGFQTQRVEQVIVRAGQTQLIEAQLALSELTEELVVTAEAPLVDVTKTQAGQTITLELTESLPTARSYQDYLQLVPGVQDSIDGDGNPASRSGVNYRDIAGDVGRSTDNLYYFDGINTTDRTLGTFGANLNTEIIQEQSVLTGAIPAEFVGVPGLVSNVVTKSGGNEFSGSVNYYLQNDSLVEDNDNFEDESFSTFDAALTLGGPIVRDKAWFFASYRLIEREEDVVSPEGVLLRSPTRESDQGFLKATWAITDSDVISGTFLNDPTDQDGSFTRTRPNSADITLEDGGERYSLGYNRVWGSASFELAGTSHESDVNRFPKNRDPANTVSFQPGANFTSDQETLGGSGTDLVELRGNESFRTSLEYLFDTGWGDHAVKVGYVYGESELFENDQTTGDPPATYISLNAGLVGTPVFLCEVVGTCGDAFSTSDYGISPDEFQNFRGNLSATQQAT